MRRPFVAEVRARALAEIAAQRAQTAHKRFGVLVDSIQQLYARLQLFARGAAMIGPEEEATLSKCLMTNEVQELLSLIVEAQLTLAGVYQAGSGKVCSATHILFGLLTYSSLFLRLDLDETR